MQAPRPGMSSPKGRRPVGGAVPEPASVEPNARTIALLHRFAVNKLASNPGEAAAAHPPASSGHFDSRGSIGAEQLQQHRQGQGLPKSKGLFPPATAAGDGRIAPSSARSNLSSNGSGAAASGAAGTGKTPRLPAPGRPTALAHEPRMGVGSSGSSGASLQGQSQGDLVARPGEDSAVEPSDGVHFAQYRGRPDGPLVVYRSAAERTANPERLNLDRRHLRACPLLKYEERVRLLNYQNNSITSIANLRGLPNLIFLDLYNNQLEVVGAELAQVPTLRVLMLGKNRIQHIGNCLETLVKLDVLDLHSNLITKVEGLSSLIELRVLNLAGNRLEIVDGLRTLRSLTELNCRRNAIHLAPEGCFDGAPHLQRVFLSNNKVARFADVPGLLSLTRLVELSLDGNPVAIQNEPPSSSSSSSSENEGNERSGFDSGSEKVGSSSNSGTISAYRRVLLERLPALRHLDLKRVSDAERRRLRAAAEGAATAATAATNAPKKQGPGEASEEVRNESGRRHSTTKEDQARESGRGDTRGSEKDTPDVPSASAVAAAFRDTSTGSRNGNSTRNGGSGSGGSGGTSESVGFYEFEPPRGVNLPPSSLKASAASGAAQKGNGRTLFICGEAWHSALEPPAASLPSGVTSAGHKATLASVTTLVVKYVSSSNLQDHILSPKRLTLLPNLQHLKLADNAIVSLSQLKESVLVPLQAHLDTLAAAMKARAEERARFMNTSADASGELSGSMDTASSEDSSAAATAAAAVGSVLPNSSRDSKAASSSSSVASPQLEFTLSDNPVCKLALLRAFVVFNVPRHLQAFNGSPLLASDSVAAQALFGPAQSLISAHNDRLALGILQQRNNSSTTNNNGANGSNIGVHNSSSSSSSATSSAPDASGGKSTGSNATGGSGSSSSSGMGVMVSVLAAKRRLLAATTDHSSAGPSGTSSSSSSSGNNSSNSSGAGRASLPISAADKALLSTRYRSADAAARAYVSTACEQACRRSEAASAIDLAWQGAVQQLVASTVAELGEQKLEQLLTRVLAGLPPPGLPALPPPQPPRRPGR